jgi:hypothetical protein
MITPPFLTILPHKLNLSTAPYQSRRSRHPPKTKEALVVTFLNPKLHKITVSHTDLLETT